MPTYQYACTACRHQFDVVQSFSDDPLSQCPACDEGRLRKLFGNVGVVFKGSGFYRTDSRADSRKKSGATIPKADSGSPGGESASASSGGSADPGGAPSSASSSKPAAKAPARAPAPA